MRKFILHFLVFGVSIMFFTDDALAKKFRIPGQEMVGTWRIVSHDLSEFPQPVPLETMDGLVRSEYFLPPGQIIEITFDGIYAQPPSDAVLPQFNFITASPISDSICRFGIWKDICKNGKVPAGYNYDNYFSLRVGAPNTRDTFSFILGDTPTRKKRWPDASSYEYSLWGDHDWYHVRILKDNKLLVMFRSGPSASYDYTGPYKGKIYQDSLHVVYMVWERVKSPENKK